MVLLWLAYVIPGDQEEPARLGKKQDGRCETHGASSRTDVKSRLQPIYFRLAPLQPD